MEPATKRTKSKPKISPAIIVAIFVVAVGISFYAGVSYQKHQTKTVVANAGANGFGPGQGSFRGGRAGNRVVGAVTAVSATSISVQNPRTGTTTTLAITSATTITNNGASAAASDIQVGSTVFVTKSSSDATQAATIAINPGYGGGQAPQTAPVTTN